MTEPVSTAQYFPWEGGAVFVGTAGVLPAHSHQAIQICFLFEGRIRLRPSNEHPWTDYDLAIVPSLQPHAMDGSKVYYGATLFVEPETRARAGAHRAHGAIGDERRANPARGEVRQRAFVGADHARASRARRLPVAGPLPASVRGADRNALARVRAVAALRQRLGAQDERRVARGRRARRGVCGFGAPRAHEPPHVRDSAVGDGHLGARRTIAVTFKRARG